MSWYISVVVPDNIIFEQLNNIASQHNIRLSILKNDCLIGQLPKRKTCLLAEWLENGYYTALENNLNSNLDFHETLCSAGFHLSGINNEFAENMKNEIANMRKVRSENAQSWMCLIRDFISKNRGEEIGLIMHFYETTFEEEKFDIMSVEEIDVMHLNEELILNIQNDVLYYFRPTE